MSAKSDEIEMSAAGEEVVSEPKVVKEKKSRKKKIELANPFGQFLREKRANEGKFNHKLACEEWSKMSKDKSEYYRKLYDEEKAAMGDGYRAKKVRKGSSEKKIFVGKQKGVKVKQLVNKAPFDNLQLLSG